MYYGHPMPRGPQPASADLVAAALTAGPAICADLVHRLQAPAQAEVAARTLKKISEADPALLLPWRKPLLAAALAAHDVRVQWNLSIVLGRLPLKGADKALAVDLMFERLRHPSGLNRTLAMQALVDLSEHDAPLRARVLPIIRDALEHGTPAMQARARKLALRLTPKTAVRKQQKTA
jgi:hypothetical protein